MNNANYMIGSICTANEWKLFSKRDKCYL